MVKHSIRNRKEGEYSAVKNIYLTLRVASVAVYSEVYSLIMISDFVIRSLVRKITKLSRGTV